MPRSRLEGIVTGLIEKRPALTKAVDVVKDVFKRIDWLKVAKNAGGLALTAFTGIPTSAQIGAIVSTLEGMLRNPGPLATKENLSSAIDDVKSILKPADSKNVPEEVEAFRKAFDRLLKDAGIEQLVMLIDDLDRCLPDFLHSLPSSRCGPWVLGGWQSMLKDAEAVTRLDRLLDGWSKVTNNEMLRLAAEAAIKTRKGRR